MKTLITIEVENEIGNPSVEEVKSFVKQILEKGLVGNFDIYKYCPMSGISLRVLSTEIERLKLTDKEIEAMAYFAHFFPVCAAEIDAASDILRNLLERTKDK
jgi:hypothetical protein